MGKLLDSPGSFRPISFSPPASQSFLTTSFYCFYFFCGIWPHSLSPPSRFPSRTVYSRSNSAPFYFILDGFNKPKPGSRTILATIYFSRAFDSVWCPAFFHKLISAGLFFTLLVGLNLSFLIGALAWFIKITKATPFESVEVFRKDPFLALFFSPSLH